MVKAKKKKAAKNAKKIKSQRSKKAANKEKIAGKIEHIFEKIQVVTTTLKNPLKAGDIIRIKGHTTDIVQEVASMQIEHKDVQKAKKGDGIGIKVNGYVRDNDVIYFADKKTAAEFRKNNKDSRPEPETCQKQVFPVKFPGTPLAPKSADKSFRESENASSAKPRFFSF